MSYLCLSDVKDKNIVLIFQNILETFFCNAIFRRLLILKTMDRETLKSALEQAVRDLKGSGRIKKNEDIVQAMGMSKGTFSSYLNGLQTPSKNFVSKFKNIYGIDLSATPGSEPSKDEPEPADKYTAALEREVEYLREIVSSKLTALMNQQTMTRAEVRAFGEYQVMKDAGGSDKTRLAIMAEINKLVGANLTGGALVSTIVGMGTTGKG